MADNKKDPIKSAQQIEADVTKLAETIENLSKQLGPLMDFGHITNSVNNMKDMVDKNDNDENDDDGNISESTEEVLIDSMFQLCEMYPNDMELGGKVRELYHKFKPNTDNTDE